MRRRKIHIACIGNELIADDAVGYEVYEHLRAMDLPADVTVHYASVGGVALLDYFTSEQAAVIVVDAVRFGAAPGTVHILDWDDVPDLKGGAISGHTIGLKETIDVARILYQEKLPLRLLLVGIEGACFNLPRDHMTPEVAKAVVPALTVIRNAVDSLQRGNDEKIH